MSIETRLIRNDGATTSDVQALKDEEREQLTELNVRLRVLQHALEATEMAAPLDEPLR